MAIDQWRISACTHCSACDACSCAIGQRAKPGHHRGHLVGQAHVDREQPECPPRHLVPVCVLAELQRAQRLRVWRHQRLEGDRGDIARLEAQASHTGLDGLGRAQPVAAGAAEPAPTDLLRGRRHQRDAAQADGKGLLPRHALRVARAEGRVFADDRIHPLQCVAGAHAGQHDRRGDDTAVDTLLELGLALQEAHGRAAGVVDGLPTAQDQHLVQQQLLELGIEFERQLADLGERAGVVGLHRPVRQPRRRRPDMQLGFPQAHDHGPAACLRRQRRGRQRIGPGRQRRRAHERVGGALDFHQRTVRCDQCRGGVGGRRGRCRRSDQQTEQVRQPSHCQGPDQTHEPSYACSAAAGMRAVKWRRRGSARAEAALPVPNGRKIDFATLFVRGQFCCTPAV